MSKLKTMLAVSGLALAIGAPSWAQEQAVTADTVVATVGGADITVGHMIAMVSTLDEEQLQLPVNMIFEGVLERLIQQEAISQSRPDPSQFSMLLIENERRSLIASEVVNELAAEIEVSGEEVQAAYDRRFADFTPAREYHASHILVETEEEASAILEELRAGADFAETAMAKSTGPTGPNGGELGWFGPGRMVPAFEAAVVTLGKGELSDPVQTEFGWHVIILNDFRDPGVPTFEEMKGTLEQEVWRDELRAGITAIVDKADVDRKDVSGIDPSVLGDYSLVGQ